MTASRKNSSFSAFPGKGFFLLLFVFGGITSLHAQWSDTINKILHGKMYPTAYFDARRSFIGAQDAHIWGFKAGVEFSDRLQGGIGFNHHNNNLTKEIHLRDINGLPDSALATLHLDYLSFYVRYVYYKTKHWKFSIIPYQLGFGNSKYKYHYNEEKHISGKRFVIIYEPGISISYKFFRWLGVGADIGYRFMLRGNPAIPENFNSPVYAFYGTIYWGELYKMAFPKSKLAKLL